MRVDNPVPQINHGIGLLGCRGRGEGVYLPSCIALQGTKSKALLMISTDQKLYEAITQIACAIE